MQECGAGRCIHTPLGEFNYMGYSVRDGRYRFTACGSSHHMTVLFFEFPLVLYLVTIRLARLPLVLYSILCIVVRTTTISTVDIVYIPIIHYMALVAHCVHASGYMYNI